MWKSVRWPRPFVKVVLVDWEENCVFISGASENFIFWLILILFALLLNTLLLNSGTNRCLLNMYQGIS